MSDERVDELRRFLRERRARVSPADVGLPATPRRRVRGLRREEVAALAGIGVTWYTALEQGEAHGVSASTLHAVADVLRLSPAEREYLLALAEGSDVEHDTMRLDPLLIETMRAIAFPAYVITSTWDVIDCNRAFKRVWSVADDEPPFNAIERMFVHPAARAMHGTRFALNVRPVIAMLRSSVGRQPNARALRALRDRLLEDTTVRALWNEDEIASPLEPNTVEIDSAIGRFRYRSLTLPIVEQRHGLVVHVPDEASKERLLRAVQADAHTSST